MTASAPVRSMPASAKGIRSIRRPNRLPVLAVLVFLATLPLEWITLSGLWGGFIKPFHVAALFLIAVAVARWRPERLLAPVLSRHGTVYFSYAFLLAVAMFGGLLHADPYLSAAEAARGAFYFVTSAVVAGMIVGLFVRPFPRGLAWAGILALTTLMIGLFGALSAQNLNPLTILADALRQGDPDIIARQLLRSAFRSGEGLEEAAPNLRHKVFGGLLVAVFLGLACRSLVDRRRPLLRGVLLVGGAVGGAAVLLSLSRSIILCLVITLTLIPLRAVVRDRTRPLGAAAATLGVLAIGILVISPVGQLIYNRVSATGSYSARLEAAGPSFIEEFLGAALIGTTKSAVEKAPHNFILDSWLSGGVLAAVAAAILILSVLRLWLREAYRWVKGRPGWVLPVGQVWVLGLGVIPLVRSFTSGTLFHMVEWTAIGLFLGLAIANERMAHARLSEPIRHADLSERRAPGA